MALNSFEQECDRLSLIVDEAQYERLRWARDEGPVLARLVALAHAAFEKRSDFELSEEASTTTVKNLILKVHGIRVLAMALFLEDGMAQMRVSSAPRGRFVVAEGESFRTGYAGLDEAWMAGALEAAFARVARAD